MLSYRNDNLGENVVLHVAANVYSGASDNFYIRLLDADPAREEALRLGTNGATAVRDGAFFGFVGKVPRLFTLAVGGGNFSLYVNGMLVLRRVRDTVHRPIGIAFDLLSYGADSTDGCVFDFELWTLPSPFRGFVEESVALAPIVERLVSTGRARAVYDLLNAIEDLSLEGMDDGAMALLRNIATTSEGYPEWLVDAVLSRMSSEGQRRWAAEAPALVDPPVIEVSDLEVRLSRNQAKDLALRQLLSRRPKEWFSVLQGIDCRFFHGDIVGIIGHNGAGKSTLLRAIAGLMPIHSGRIAVRGNFMLMRGGLGIRPELTGRQNIISAGIYLGLAYRQIMQLMDGIISFAELEEHIDRPVKYYSDGMLSRLIFSTATSVSPEILLLDELLGAGDIKFQQKAQQRLHQFITQAKLVVLVTHGVGFVREHCNKALVLSKGRQIYFGDPQTAVTRYMNDLHLSSAPDGTSETSRF